jgi:hypothetical protein
MPYLSIKRHTGTIACKSGTKIGRQMAFFCHFGAEISVLQGPVIDGVGKGNNL